MQRSRKDLMQRRAASEKNAILGRKRLYKVSLSLVLLTWGLIFLLNSFISHGNGFRDGLGSVVGESTWHEAHLNTDKGSDSCDVVGISDATNSCQNTDEGSDSCDAVEISDTACNSDVQKTLISRDETVQPTAEIVDTENDKASLLNIGKNVIEEKSNLGSGEERETANGMLEIPVKSERISRIAPPGLDEFKSKAITAKEKPSSSQTGSVIHRVEPGGKEYNYASSTKGAKVLAFNKEAKGAFNILDKDKDKYLRNACSAEDKFVVIELSEETLVVTIEIANFEHYSSNLKDFEVLSSLVYPTDNWVKLGNFTAANVKHAQKFPLPEPKWARYLKLNLLSHYGSEFYCTLSAVEVYGVDAVERMLEDLITVQNSRVELEGQNLEQKPVQEPNDDGVSLYEEFITEMDSETAHGSPKTKRDASVNGVSDPIAADTRPSQVGRMPGDTVLKILLQKVQSLDVNFAVLERYIEESNTRYARIVKDFDDDIAGKEMLLEKIKLEIKNLQNSKDVFAKDLGELLSWKIAVSSQLGQLVIDNAILRSEVQRIANHQVDMENKGLAVIFLSFVFGCLAVTMLFTDMLRRACRIHNCEKFCRTSSGWLMLLLSSTIISFILVL